MKATLLKLISVNLILFLMLGLTINPSIAVGQDAESQTEDTTSAIQDNSSSFNDSVQFDDMEPIFYEAAEDEAEESDSDGTGGMMLYAGIAVVLLVVLIVLRRMGRKKAS